MSGIYSAITPDNRMYVGQTKRELSVRVGEHYRKAPKSTYTGGLSEAIIQHDRNIVWGWILSGLTCNQQCLDNMETFYIYTKDTYNNGLNLHKIGGCPPDVTGIKRSTEHRLAIAKSNTVNKTGKKHSDNAKINMKASHAIRVKNYSYCKKPVEVEGIKFESRTDAAIYFNVDNATITNWVISGKHGAKHCDTKAGKDEE